MHCYLCFTIVQTQWQWHSLNVIHQAVQHTKPGQTTVVTVDQPLHALDKEIQWLRTDTYGETKFLIVMGGLIHIEMAFLRVLGGLAGWCWVVSPRS